MLGRFRNPILIGAACVATAVLYAVLAEPFGYPVEWAGVTMLIALGAALGIMVAVLDTGQGD